MLLPQINFADKELSPSTKVRLLIAQASVGLYMYVKLFEGRDFLSWLWELYWVPAW